VYFKQEREKKQTHILIYQADIWEKREKTKHENLGNCSPLEISKDGGLRETRLETEIQWLLEGPYCIYSMICLSLLPPCLL
jgi:hypothetical protein